MNPQHLTCELRMPDADRFYDHIKSNAKYARRMLAANSHKGQTVTICGAGPSLADECTRLPDTTHVWACNSALPYLMDRGVRVTHGFAIDQGEAMLGPEEWERTFNVRYYLASSVHPRLADHLAAHGRHVSFFHNFLGIPDPAGWTLPAESAHLDAQYRTTAGTACTYELYLYSALYTPSVQVGHGLNSATRAACLALAMGFSHVYVVGADCACKPNSPKMPDYNTVESAEVTPEYRAWMRQLVMYADGRSAAVHGDDALLAEAPDIAGTRWHTRPDMVISAAHLLDLERGFPGRVTLVGDTLPNAIRTAAQSDPSFMDDMPKLTPKGVEGFGNAATHQTTQPERAVA